MPRREVRGRILDEAQPLLGPRRLSRAFSTQDPAKLAEELGRLVDAVESLSVEYAAPRLTLLPVAYAATELALGFIAPVEPGDATVTATLPFTAPQFAGCSLAVAKRGVGGIVRVTRRTDDQLLQGDETSFDCVEPGLYKFFTDGESWYREPDWNTRIEGVEASIGDLETAIDDVEASIGTALTIGSPRLLGRYSPGIGLAQEVTIDDSLEMTVGGALQRAAITGDVTIPAGGNAAAIAAGAIVNADVNAAAGIALSKLESLAARSVVARSAATSGAAAALTAGSENTYLGRESGTLSFSTIPRAAMRDWGRYVCSVTRSTNQSFSWSAGFQACEWNSELSDSDALHSTGSNTSRITIPAAGLWLLAWDWFSDRNGTLRFRRDGSTQFSDDYTTAASTIHSGIIFRSLPAGYVELLFDTIGTLDATSSGPSCQLTVISVAL